MLQRAFRGGVLAASIALSPAGFAGDWVPSANVAFAFDSGGRVKVPTLSFAATGLTDTDVQSLPLVAFAFGGRSGRTGTVLGLPIGPARLAEEGETQEEATGSSWIWWALGGAAAIGAVALLGGGSDETVNDGGQPGGSCSTVGGTTLAPPDNVTVDPTCGINP